MTYPEVRIPETPMPTETKFGEWRAWQERAPQGPWHVDMGERGELYVGHLPSGKPDTEGAHLIAAAPELYEALHAILSRHDGFNGLKFVEAAEQGRRALTKARGEP